MPTITYVPKEKLYPAFGICHKDGLIEIREDLPWCVKDFLEVHELYHSTDTETIWWKREIKANWAGLKSHPVGFIVTACMSLAPYRIKLYWQRFRDKK
jgi:hypothetical protein